EREGGGGEAGTGRIALVGGRGGAVPWGERRSILLTDLYQLGYSPRRSSGQGRLGFPGSLEGLQYAPCQPVCRCRNSYVHSCHHGTKGRSGFRSLRPSRASGRAIAVLALEGRAAAGHGRQREAARRHDLADRSRRQCRRQILRPAWWAALFPVRGG